MKTIAFFSTAGGVGKTTLVYHLAHMIASRGQTVLAVDLDPQANLTSMFLNEDQLEDLWPNGEHPNTIFGALRPIIRGSGDVQMPHMEEISPQLNLITGDMALSTFEDRLSAAWLGCHHRDESAFRLTTAFYRAIQMAATHVTADWVLVDVGTHVGATNRATLIACDHVVVPLCPDMFSLHGLRNLGATLRSWRADWQDLRCKSPNRDMLLPNGDMQPLGYVIMQMAMPHHQLPKVSQRWIDRFPSAYREDVLEQATGSAPAAAQDPYNLAMLKHYRSLMPMAMEARKPVFSLKPADGAIGAHSEAARAAHQDFLSLAQRIAERCGAVLP